jgi:hypothetical protein
MTKGCSGFVESEKKFCGRNLSFNDVKFGEAGEGRRFQGFKWKNEGR